METVKRSLLFFWCSCFSSFLLLLSSPSNLTPFNQFPFYFSTVYTRKFALPLSPVCFADLRFAAACFSPFILRRLYSQIRASALPCLLRSRLFFLFYFAPSILANSRFRAPLPASQTICSLIDAKKTNVCFAAACFFMHLLYIFLRVKSMEYDWKNWEI